MSAAVWKIDAERSRLAFSVKYLAFTPVPCTMTRFSGEARLDDEDMTRSSVTVRIDAASFKSDDPKRDEDVRKSFLDVAQHPEILFESRRVEAAGPGRYRVEGELELRGVRRPVELSVSVRDVPDAKVERRFEVEAEFDRRPFGVRWSSPLDAIPIFISHKVRVTIDAVCAP